MSDNKKNKQTLVGMGAPTAEEIAADAAKKAAEATDAVETEVAEAEAKVAEVATALESKGSNDESEDNESEDDESEDDESEDDESDRDESDHSDYGLESDDETPAVTTSAKRKRESAAPKAAAAAAAAKVDASDGASETRRPALYLAEYETPEALHEAACRVRDEGFENWDCHTPYAIHGMDEAMGLPPTKIGIISFIHAVIGLTTAVLMIQYMNNWDYPIIVGGKPAGAFAPMVPIMFELTVLLTGFGTLFGLLHLAGLPRHHHPIFESDRFAASTDDKFFISIEVKDPNFDIKKTRELLEGTNPSHLELVEEDLV